MKKLLLTLLAASGLFAAQATAPAYVWHKLIDSPQSDITQAFTVTTDGNIVSIGNFGSKTDTDNISIDGEVVATGAATNSASDNLNLLIVKLNADNGNKIWVVSSKKGDIAESGRNVITATPDGGVLAFFSLRSSSTTPYANPVLVDASGAEVELLDWNLSAWVKYQTLVKISKDGIIEWVRPIIADQLPVPNASSGSSVNNTTVAAFQGGVVTDAEGNIYIGGNYRAPLIFNGDRNSVYILTARNLETYTGDIQKGAGGFYLVKLDSNGNYLSHLKSSSTGFTYEQIYDMQLSGDKLYFAGKLEGAAGSTLVLDPKSTKLTLEKKSARNSLMLAAVETSTLKPVFATCYDGVPTSSSSATIKFMKLAINGDNVYLMGAINKCGLAPNGSDEVFVTVPQGITMQRGFIAKVSATDGTAAGGFVCTDDIPTNGITEYEDGYEADGKIYTAGYHLGSKSFIDEIDPSDFSLVSRKLIAEGNVSMLSAARVDLNKKLLVTATRCNNADLTINGDSDLSAGKSAGFGSVVTCHSFGETGAINGVENDARLTVSGEAGAVVINASEATEISVIDMQGRLVDKRTAAAGETRIPLAAGFYLVNNVKVAVK